MKPVLVSGETGSQMTLLRSKNLRTAHGILFATKHWSLTMTPRKKPLKEEKNLSPKAKTSLLLPFFFYQIKPISKFGV